MNDKLPPSKFGAGYTYGGPPNPSGGGPSTPSGPPLPTGSPPPAPATYQNRQTAGHYALPPGVSISPTTPGHTFPSPSSATAIAAAVLGLVIAVQCGWSAVSAFQTLSWIASFGLGEHNAYIVGTGTVSAISAALLALGSILLLSRVLAGRLMVSLGCLGAIGIQIVGWIYSYTLVGRFSAVLDLGSNVSGLLSTASALGLLIAGLSLLLPCAALLLALSGSTRRWCETRNARVAVAPISGY